MMTKFSVLDQTNGIPLRLRVKFHLDQFILSPSSGENTKFCCLFGLRHFVVSPVGGGLRLTTGAQL